jgi:hypothetical protein
MTGLAFGTVWETRPGDYPVLIALASESNESDGTGNVSIAEAIDDNNDSRIGDFEILDAIRLWRTGETVPNTGGKTIDDFKVLDLISLWRQGASVGS